MSDTSHIFIGFVVVPHIFPTHYRSCKPDKVSSVTIRNTLVPAMETMKGKSRYPAGLCGTDHNAYMNY
jgi:hypothetical protein